MSEIPLEIINLIYSYIERHPIMDVICCCKCGTNDYWHLYIYHKPYHSSFRKFEILCPDCNYDTFKNDLTYRN